jgi:hypothetical protein
VAESEFPVTVKIEETLQKFIADRGLVHAIVAVIKERQRQVDVEGYTAAHDDEHDGGDLAAAGSCYMLNAACVLHPMNGTPMEFETAKNLAGWPWEEKHWKPKDPHTDLVRGVALGIAEIMRLDRVEAAALKEPPQS